MNEHLRPRVKPSLAIISHRSGHFISVVDAPEYGFGALRLRYHPSRVVESGRVEFDDDVACVQGDPQSGEWGVSVYGDHPGSADEDMVWVHWGKSLSVAHGLALDYAGQVIDERLWDRQDPNRARNRAAMFKAVEDLFDQLPAPPRAHAHLDRIP